MAEENKEVTQEVTEQPQKEVKQVDESKFESAGDDSVFKVDFNNPPESKNEEVEKQPVEEEVVVVNEEIPEPPKEEVVEEKQDLPTLEEVTVEDLKSEEGDNKIVEDLEETTELPEQLQKIAQFMDETGGDLNDYVNLNRDIEKMDDSEVLDEYYRSTKSHLSPEERSFLLEDSFGVDEDVDDDKTIRKKKIALKEQVAEAKAHLDRQKSKYYEDIKAGSKLTEEQQKAINFFNEFETQKVENDKLAKQAKSSFTKKTNEVFNDEFKGFEYKVGDKRFRFNVKDANKVKQTQSDINNFVNKFVGKDNMSIEDAAGYHKSFFTAMNADAIASHFYEQGKADAIKDRVAKDKNINTEPRQTHGETNVGGVKYRVLGESANDFKFKIKSKNKK